MEAKDIEAVQDLVNRYQARFQLNQKFSRGETEHLLLQQAESDQDQVVWSYVVEDPESHKVTDFVSFYSIDSSVIHNDKHNNIKAAYLYYYATETAFTGNQKALGERLQLLINDALIKAKKVCFSAFAYPGLWKYNC